MRGLLERFGRGALLLSTSASPGGWARAEGWIAGVAYVVVARLGELAEGVVNLMSLGGKEGLLALGQGLGRALLPWLAALMLAEWASKRRHAGVLVTPLVTSALLFRGGEWMGVWESSSRLVFDVVGLLGCWYLGHRARSAAVDPAPAVDEVNSPSGEEPAVTLEVVDDGGTGAARGRRPLLTSLGGALLLGAMGVGVRRARALWTQREMLGPLGPGRTIPEFRARTLSGEVFGEGSLRAAPTMLVFWATWCGYCARQMPDVEEMHRTLGARGLRVIGVNTDRDGDQEAMVRDYIARKELSFPQVLDTGRVARAFRNTMLPHIVFVSAEGEVVRVFQGKTSAQTLRQAAEALLNAGA